MTAPFVMAGLDPAIYVFVSGIRKQDVNARHMAGHDERVCIDISIPDTPSPSRGAIRPSFANRSSLRKQGRRECRASNAPAASHAK
jgi:hypothetical protein